MQLNSVLWTIVSDIKVPRCAKPSRLYYPAEGILLLLLLFILLLIFA